MTKIKIFTQCASFLDYTPVHPSTSVPSGPTLRTNGERIYSNSVSPERRCRAPKSKGNGKQVITCTLRVFILFFLLIAPLWASPSLFFTQHEIQLIHSANTKAAKTPEVLNLSGIVYLDQDHWSFCLNNKLIRPQQPLNIKGLQLEQVTPQKVIFYWRSPPSSKVLKFTLRPNQTIVLNEGEVDSHGISQN